jgi:LCP family protein required for cell wall assembly
MAQKLLTAGLIVAFLMIAAMAGLFVFDQVRQFIAASDILPEFTHSAKPSEVTFDPTKPLPRWEGTDRVNVLVMGIDERKHEQGPWRTDTMLVLTIDPVSMTGGMLSIPRDLWVPIPGYEEDRINKAHFIGDLHDYPGGGPALAAETVQYNFGVPIDYYARVNFTAFEQVVDLIGGIDVYVEEEIVDPTYPAARDYGYDPLYVAAGWQHFDGERALKYARTRHTEGGDFDRAKRQQQVMTAIFEQVTRLDLLPQLAPRVTELWNTLEDAVVTDLTLDEAVALAVLATDVEPGNIRYGVVDEYYTQFWETPEKQQVLIPLRDRIREMRDYIFTTAAPPPQANDPTARLAAEAATIEILNGTEMAGLASTTAELLEQHSLQVTNVGNADRSDYTESLVIVYTGKIYTAEYLTRLLNLPPTAVVHGGDPNAEHDISLIIGADYEPSQPAGE